MTTTRPTPGGLSARGDHSQAKPGKGKTITLSVADAVFLGLRHNRTVRGAYIDRIAQKFDLRVAEDMFTPHVTVDASAVRERVGGIDSIAGEVTPSASMLMVSGGSIDFVWANTAARSGDTESRSSVASMSLVQPLLRGAGREVAEAPLRRARLNESVNQLRLEQTISETIGSIILAHRALVSAQEQRKLAEASVARAEDLIAVTRALIKAGRLPAVEIVQSEADLENQRLQVLTAEASLESARLELLSLLSLDLGQDVTASEDLAPRKIVTSLPRLMGIAMTRRPDLRIQALNMDQGRLGVTVARNERLWDLSFFTNSRFGRLSSSGPDFSMETRISDVSVGLTLSAPLNDLSREQSFVSVSTSLQRAEIELAGLRQGIEQQVRTARSTVDIGWRQLEVARRARALALRAIEIEKEKLKTGRSTNFQVRSLETELRAADAQLLSATIRYLNAATLLDLSLGTTLDTWHITVADEEEVLPWSLN